MMRITVDKWKDFCQEFAGFFQHINGSLERTDDQVTFRSPVNRVSTHLSVFRNGEFSATMPLHGIDSKISEAIFNVQEKSVQILGEAVDYTYRVPSELQSK